MIDLLNLDLNEFDTLLFDLDGTLIDSKKSNFLAYKSAVAETGRDLIESDFNRFWGQDASVFLPAIFNDLHQSEILLIKQLKPKYFKLYLNEILTNAELINVIEKVFHTHKIGLVTTAKLASVNLVLDNFNLTKYFSLLVTGDDQINPKPSPEPYLLALKKLNSKPSKTLVFEDSETGVSSALKANLKVIKVDFNSH